MKFTPQRTCCWRTTSAHLCLSPTTICPKVSNNDQKCLPKDSIWKMLNLNDKMVILVLTKSRKSRSEEHTSELQSLMRNSYDVFCLKKQKIDTKTIYTHTKQLTTR